MIAAVCFWRSPLRSASTCTRLSSMPNRSVASMSVVIFTSSIDLPLDMLFSIEGKQFAFTFYGRFQVHGSCPNAEQVLQRIFRVIYAQVNTLMPMLQQQLASVFEIAIRHINEWLAEVREREQQLLLDALPITIRDFIYPAFRVELICKESFLV